MTMNQDYLPCPPWMLDLKTFNGFTNDSKLWWKGITKVPIKAIKEPNIYPNEIEPQSICYILSNFYPEAWEPVMVDDNFFLRDGQHRLEVARRLGLKYIDVILIPEASLKPAV